MKNSIKFNGKKRDYYISFMNTKHFPMYYIGWWFFMYKKFKYTNGFELRICGVHIKAIEKGALEKLFGIAKEKRKNL